MVSASSKSTLKEMASVPPCPLGLWVSWNSGRVKTKKCIIDVRKDSSHYLKIRTKKGGSFPLPVVTRGVSEFRQRREKKMHHQRARPVVAAGVVDPATPSSHEGLSGCMESNFIIHWEVSSIGLLPLSPPPDLNSFWGSKNLSKNQRLSNH